VLQKSPPFTVPMAYVPSLPVELISRILEVLDSKTTLFNAALCSKQWYDVAAPHMYCSLQLAGTQDTYEPTSPSLMSSTGSIEAALKLFLRKPHLGAYVRHLAVRPAFHDGDIGQENKDLTLEEARRRAKDLDTLIQDAVAHDAPSEKDHAKLLNRALCTDGLLALLIPRLPKLETLDLEIPISPGFVQDLLDCAGTKKAPFETEPVLTHLHSIVWAHDDNKYGGSMLASPLLLPSLKSLFLHRIGTNMDGPNTQLASIERQTSACTHLEFKDCRFCEEDIKNYLSVPRQLSTFVYEVGWGHLAYCSTSFTALRDGLECQKDHLENLWLDYGFDGIEWMDDLDEHAPMKSMKSFSKLKHLRIAGDYVFGGNLSEEEAAAEDRRRMLPDFLPATLETLHITHGDEHSELLYRAFDYVIEEKEVQRVPGLRTITLDTSLLRIKEDGARLAGIIRQAQRAGIEFRLINNWGDQKWKMYDKRVESKWGFNEDIEWMECNSGCHKQPPFEVVDLQL
jgi:hypothetical protein